MHTEQPDLTLPAKTSHFYQALFKSTFLISAFTVGGGFVIIPLLKAKYVDEYGWLNDKDALDLVAIAQSMVFSKLMRCFKNNHDTSCSCVLPFLSSEMFVPC